MTGSEFVLQILLAFGVFAASLDVSAQAAGKVPLVGVIGERTPPDPFLDAFRQGLRERGYVEGRSILIEYRSVHGVLARAPDYAAELLRLKVDILVVGGTVAAQSAKARTATVPIVFTLSGDPVGSGLVDSLARPGGNATGLTNLISELPRKQLELLKTAAPQLSRVTLLYNPANPSAILALKGAREAARALGLELQFLEVRQSNELERAFSALTAWRAGAVLAVSDPVFGNVLVQLSALAVTNRLPAMYASREFAKAGGLIAYGPNFSDNYRRAATYVDRILKGANPADLPVEQPTKFDLVINAKTAKALGLTIPPSLLLQVTEFIE